MKRTHLFRLGARGFTMVELLLVILILSVILGLIAPKMSGMLAGNQVDGLASRIASDVLSARMDAIRSGRRVDFVIASGGTRTSVVRSGVGGGAAQTVRSLNVASEFPSVTLSTSVDGPATFSFDSRGLMTSNNEAVITVSRGNSQQRMQISSVGTVYRDYTN